MTIRASLSLWAALGALPGQPPAPPPAPPNGEVILTVGPSGQYRKISDAAAAANANTDPNNHYIIDIAPGTYTNDFPVVTRPMTIEVDPRRAGSPVLLEATVSLPNQKGIILTFASLTVDGLTLYGGDDR